MMNSVNNYPIGIPQVPNVNWQSQQNVTPVPNTIPTGIGAGVNNLTLMPDKRDIVPSRNNLCEPIGSSYDFIKNVSSDILIAQQELEVNILKDRLNAFDTTATQKFILNDMLKDAESRLAKLQQEQGVKQWKGKCKMSISGNLNNVLANYNNNYLNLGHYDNKYVDKLARNVEKVDSALLSFTPPSQRADIMWRRNLLAQLTGQKEIYPSAEVCKAQYAPYIGKQTVGRIY